ncbi:hypothetical protein HPP92_028410 [Vanilla planifolia]|uniref:Uncharacterized protein n=1 Tax=Vanilla planifolia TaxID=51239 RepID=A0A835P7E0_VANPL|nr:hypothetical protein HPP92_028410 [Vanilla planifolia]
MVDVGDKYKKMLKRIIENGVVIGGSKGIKFSNAPARVHNKEGGGARHHPHPPKAAQPIGEEFMSRKVFTLKAFASLSFTAQQSCYEMMFLIKFRFSRNAGLVASAVARNLNRVGNYIKRDI